MMENYDKEFWENKKCPKYDCRKESCKCGLKKVYIPTALGDDSKDSSVAPKNGAYCNAIVVYEANGNVYIYSADGVPTLVEKSVKNLEEYVKLLKIELDKEILDRDNGDKTLQQEIDDLKNSPDVVDIVATYATLQAYDTSKLGDNDIIRVLADETHDGQSTYYRWSTTTSTWTYIGAVGDYYTKGQVDTLLGGKQDKLTAGSNINISAQNVISATDTTYSDFTGATMQQAGTSGLVPAPTTSDPDKYLKGDGSWGTPTDTTYTAGTNVQISSGNVISATDTTYSTFTGTDGNTGGTAGLVPAPATTDAGKFLNANGTWDTVNVGPTVVQSTGTSTTDVMSQNAVSTELFNDPATKDQVKIGSGSASTGTRALAIGHGAFSAANYGVAIGSESTVYIGANSGISIGNFAKVSGEGGIAMSTAYHPNNATASGSNSVAISRKATASGLNAIALGANSSATKSGAIALGGGSSATNVGEMNIGTNSTSLGYNSSNYRLLSGVYDGQNAHDAATVAQGNTLATAAPDTSTVGVLGQLWTDTTNMHTYQCTAISGSTYTWTQRW